MKRKRDSSMPTATRVAKMMRSPSKQITSNDFLLSVEKAKVVRGNILKDDFFHQHSASEMEAYGMEVTRAIRSRDFEKVKQLHEEGQILQCSNRFGESLLHMACRHGSLDIVKFLIGQADVSLQVRDDCGKTPLHDAFWNATPNAELVNYLIERCPCLLFISDNRGHTPLQYARMEHHAHWISFLEKRLKLIIKGIDDLEKAISTES